MSFKTKSKGKALRVSLVKPVAYLSMSYFLVIKKPKDVESLGLVSSAWQFPTFTWQTATLSSALSGFTSEFGMGSGGSRSLMPSGKKGIQMSCFDACRVRAVMH